MKLNLALAGMALTGFLFSCKNEQRHSPKKTIDIEFSTPHEHLKIEDSLTKNFIPEDQVPIKWVTGKTTDGLLHYVVYVSKDEKVKIYNSEGFVKRTLMILEEKNGHLKEILKTQNAVECIHCSSLERDAFVDLLSTDEGFQLVFGMTENQYWTEIKTFIYDGNQNFDLIRDQYYIFNNEAAAKQFDTLAVSYKEDLTPKDFGKIKLTNFNIYNEARR